MRHIHCLIYIFVGAAWICSAQVSLHSPQMGYELYSWPNPDGGWTYSIRPNTNDEATVEEVFSKESQLKGIGEVKKAISRLPKGAIIYWLDRIPSGKGPAAKGSEILGYPPAKVRELIRSYAGKYQIEVQIPNSLFRP